MKKIKQASLQWPVLKSVEIVSVGDVWGERFHRTPSHELLHVLDGHAKIQFVKRSFTVGPGDVCVIPKNTSHRDIHAESENYRVMYVFFQWPKEDRRIRDIDPAAILSAPDGVRPHLHLMMNELKNEYLGDSLGAHDRMRLILTEILLALIRYSDGKGKPSPRARQRVAKDRHRKLTAEVREHLEKHFDQPISLEALAAFFRISPFHLSRTFSQVHGISLIEMLTIIRIEKAKECLQKERLSIKEVAVRVGFGDSNYFTKVFRRISGISPTEFQVKLRSRS